MNRIDLGTVAAQVSDTRHPTVLYDDGGNAVYWLGIPEDTAFRCNVFLVTGGDDALLVDPGGKQAFDFVHQRVAQIIDPAQVSGMVLSHQDPDVAGSMVDWLGVNPDMQVMASPRTNVLLPHYGAADYRFYDTVERPEYRFASGRMLQFIEAPFLHFPGALTTYDLQSQFLFSGDIWAALDTDWKLVVNDFTQHCVMMNLFHTDYMACNVATRGFVDALAGLDIAAILPQHGSIIPQRFVGEALEYLGAVQCGLDIIYPQ